MRGIVGAEINTLTRLGLWPIHPLPDGRGTKAKEKRRGMNSPPSSFDRRWRSLAQEKDDDDDQPDRHAQEPKSNSTKHGVFLFS